MTELSALPSPKARILAFAGICMTGMLGAVAGYGLADLQCDGTCFFAHVLSSMGGALFAAAGASVLAVITLRALPQWRAVGPEAGTGGRRMGSLPDDPPI
jgi:hypothetical protein